nr:hypothetical protein CFP56_51041 [Quercus suber]
MGEEVLEKYFATIFTSSNPSGFEEILEGVQQSEVEVGEMDMGGASSNEPRVGSLEAGLDPPTVPALMKCLQASASPLVAAAHLTKLSGLILRLVHSPPAVHMNSLLPAKGSARLIKRLVSSIYLHITGYTPKHFTVISHRIV